MNRILRRPMFRTGGSAEGITSGLQPRQGYEFGKDVQKITQQRDLINALAPRKDTGMRDFLINFGLDLASRPPQGSIFSTAAAAAKGPFEQYQAKKIHAEQSDRDLISQLVKGMNDDELSALMKDVQAGVDSGLFPDEKTGVQLLLKKKLYGVLKEPGEIKQETVQTRAGILLEQDEDLGYDSAISIANAAQAIFDGKVEGVTADQIDTDQLYVEPETWLYMGTPDEDTGIYTIPTDASDGDKNDFNETYQDGMLYYNYRNKMWYQKSGKQLIPLQQPE